MGQYVDFYCRNQNKELKKIVDPILYSKFAWIPQQEYDDFYSIASMVVWDCEKKFDCKKVKTKKFKSFLSGCIHNKIKTHVTYMNRNKRMLKDDNGNPIRNVSFDAPIEGEIDIKEKIDSGFSVAEELNLNEENTERVQLFLDNFSGTTKKIISLIMEGKSIKDIRKILNLTEKEYRDYWSVITAYENKKLLYKKNDVEEEEMINQTVLTEDVAESYKNTSYSIASISKQLQKNRIRDDHILQRYSGQWKAFAKSELVSDILRGKSLTQIIISEEIKNGLRMQWLIDGKQRCTTLNDYLNDGFAISKNVKNYNIRYQTTKVDEDGNEVLNEDGFTEVEFREFDIRNKKFSQLPDELQEIFEDRQIPVLYNMNCTKKDIADDIARFNRSRPMNVAQNGWLGLEEGFAELVENICKMPFFKKDFNGSSFTVANNTSGKIRRLVVEAVMASDFIEEFGNFEKMCEFLSEEASDSNFTEIYALIERLTLVCDERVAEMFNITDGFLWIGLFSRFSVLGFDDSKFVDFITEFERSMKDIKVQVTYNGVDMNSYNDLSINPETKKTRATKDKNMVIAKMTLLEKLMHKYLHINEEDLEEVSILEFVKENVKPDATEEDVEFYFDILDDLTLEVDNNTKLLDEHNKPSLVALVGYACEEDKDGYLEEWIKNWFNKNSTYLLNQTENYLHMKENFEQINKNAA